MSDENQVENADNLEMIKMTAPKSAGAFVETLQGKTGTGFAEGTRVHKDWWAKTITYDQAMEKAENAARERKDVEVPRDSILAKVVGEKFVLEINGQDYKPTDHALQQLSMKIGVRSASILREMYNDEEADEWDAATMAQLVNNEVRKQENDKSFIVRTYTDGTLRAVLSERYAVVDNRWYLEVLKEFLPDGRLSHWRGDEDTIYGNIILPNTIMDYGQSDDSDYGGMLSIGNCEIGTRTVYQRPSLFRSICMNGCIWGQCFGTKIKQRHLGNIDLELLKKQIAENVAYQLPLYETGVHRFLKMQKRKIKDAKIDAVIAVTCDEMGLEKSKISKVVDQWHKHESDHANLFGVINAVTRAGQEFKNADWVKLDEMAGKLLDLSEDRWDLYIKKASQFTKKDYEKAGLVLAA